MVDGSSRRIHEGVDGQTLLGRLGSWQLVRLLSEGNFTRVYQARAVDIAGNRAEDGPTQRRSAAYVVKVLRKEWWRDPQAIEMQRREAWVGSQVSHPNLLPVLSASVQEPPFYVVTPKLEAAPLSQLIAERAPLAVPLALWICPASRRRARRIVRSDGHDPHRRQAGEYFGVAGRPRDAHRFRFRANAGRGQPMGHAAACRDAGVHCTGNGDLGPGRRAAQRHLQSRRDAVRNAHRPPAVGQRRPGRAGHSCTAKPSRRNFAQLRPDVPAAVAELIHSMLAKDPLRRPGTARELATRLVRLEIESFTLR